MNREKEDSEPPPNGAPPPQPLVRVNGPYRNRNRAALQVIVGVSRKIYTFTCLNSVQAESLRLVVLQVVADNGPETLDAALVELRRLHRIPRPPRPKSPPVRKERPPQSQPVAWATGPHPIGDRFFLAVNTRDPAKRFTFTYRSREEAEQSLPDLSRIVSQQDPQTLRAALEDFRKKRRLAPSSGTPKPLARVDGPYRIHNRAVFNVQVRASRKVYRFTCLDFAQAENLRSVVLQAIADNVPETLDAALIDLRRQHRIPCPCRPTSQPARKERPPRQSKSPPVRKKRAPRHLPPKPMARVVGPHRNGDRFLLIVESRASTDAKRFSFTYKSREEAEQSLPDLSRIVSQQDPQALPAALEDFRLKRRPASSRSGSVYGPYLSRSQALLSVRESGSRTLHSFSCRTFAQADRLRSVLLRLIFENGPETLGAALDGLRRQRRTARSKGRAQERSMRHPELENRKSPFGGEPSPDNDPQSNSRSSQTTPAQPEENTPCHAIDRAQTPRKHEGPSRRSFTHPLNTPRTPAKRTITP